MCGGVLPTGSWRPKGLGMTRSLSSSWGEKRRDDPVNNVNGSLIKTEIPASRPYGLSQGWQVRLNIKFCPPWQGVDALKFGVCWIVSGCYKTGPSRLRCRLRETEVESSSWALEKGVGIQWVISGDYRISVDCRAALAKTPKPSSRSLKGCGYLFL